MTNGEVLIDLRVDFVGDETFKLRLRKDVINSNPDRYEVNDNNIRLTLHTNKVAAEIQYDALIARARARLDRQGILHRKRDLREAMQKNPDCGAF